MTSNRAAVLASEQRPHLVRLRAALERAWSAETSANPDWSASLPSAGQCAVTSLVLQDMFGGTLLRAEIAGQSHYWNRLPDGTDLDLTKDQFPDFCLDTSPIERSRDYVLSFASTRERYTRLRSATSLKRAR
jgi:hypothetical protein